MYLRLWKTQPSIAQMPTIHLDKALESSLLKSYRWKSHNDWVEQIRIDRRLNQIISCSNDENYAVIIGCILPSTDISSHIPQNGGIVASTQNINPIESGSQSNQQSNQQPNLSINQNQQNNEANISQQQQLTNQNVNNQTSNTNTNNFLSSSLNASMMEQQNKRLSNTTNLTNNQNRATTPQHNDKYKQEKQDQQSQSVQHIGSIAKANELKRRPESNETVFKVNKGVKTFDFSFEKNLLITGG